MLQLMMEVEQDLWAWPLCQVRILDLDMERCDSTVLDHLRNLLLKKLDLEENLCSLNLRCIAAAPQIGKDRDGSMSAADRELIRLVNPVHPKFPAGSCTSFLVPDE